MQETSPEQVAATKTAMNEYLKAALMGTELLRQILCTLLKGGDLSLTAWHVYAKLKGALPHIK
jgi:hypothetical protein